MNTVRNGVVYTSFCPNCKYTTYSTKFVVKRVVFKCSCGTTWTIPEQQTRRK